MKPILIFLFTLCPVFCFSQSLSISQIDSLIVGIKRIVNENYVLADKAKIISDSLQSKNYYQVETIDLLMNNLNNDIFHLVKDKHLFIQYRPAVAENLLSKKGIHEEQNKRE